MPTIRKQPATFIETDVDDETVVVSLATGEFFSLKGTGLAAWRAIDGAVSQQDLVRRLADEFDAAPATIERDLAGYLSQLVKAGFVTIA